MPGKEDDNVFLAGSVKKSHLDFSPDVQRGVFTSARLLWSAAIAALTFSLPEPIHELIHLSPGPLSR
jgi:hypothetical protein